MHDDNFDSWAPQVPPTDFADTMVAKMLAEPVAVADAGEAEVVPLRRGRHRLKIAGLLLAAALVATTSWAMLGDQPVLSETPPDDTLHEPPPREPVMAPLFDAPTAHPEPEVPTPKVARAASPPPPAEITVESEGIGLVGPGYTKVPRCDCAHQFTMCSCVGQVDQPDADVEP